MGANEQNEPLVSLRYPEHRRHRMIVTTPPDSFKSPAIEDAPCLPAEATRFRAGHSRAQDPRQAVREFHAAVAQPAMALVVFFCSSDWDLEIVAEAMARLF